MPRLSRDQWEFIRAEREVAAIISDLLEQWEDKPDTVGGRS
jgi:hypothetical protein